MTLSDIATLVLIFTPSLLSGWLMIRAYLSEKRELKQYQKRNDLKGKQNGNS